MELKPCPNGHTDVVVDRCWDGGNLWGGRCVTCNWTGPSSTTKKVAVVRWNRRTPDRAALVEVARRALNTPGFGMHNHSSLAMAEQQQDAAAERIVTEYLAEQAGKEGE